MYPWLEPELDRLLERWQTRPPHAVLLTGREGIGLDELAIELARALLCETPVSGHRRACGKCPACNWFAQGNHPDFRLVQPEIFDIPAEGSESTSKEKKSEQIKIDQIRDLQGFLSIGTHRGGRRVIVVRPAQAMNSATQNSLLKSLEEPGPGTLFLLVSSEPHRLLPTVRSRCQKVPIAKPSAAVAIQWLTSTGASDPSLQFALAAGAPVAAEKMGDSLGSIRTLVAELANPRSDALSVAAGFQSTTPAEFIDVLYRWCHDLLMLKTTGQVRYFSQNIKELKSMTGSVSAPDICRFLRRLVAARTLAQHPLNARLVFEELLLGYRAMFQ